MSWIPLHVHSQYSILDSTASVTALIQKAAEYQMPALALTDQGNLYGAVEFFKECKNQHIQPILGCELYVAPGSRFEKKKSSAVKAGYPVVLLVKNQMGYRNLCKLSSYAHLEGFYYTPRIDKELLQEFHEGLICLSGPMRSRLVECILQDDLSSIQAEITWYHQLFKEDYYLELTRHFMSEQMMRSDGMEKEFWLFQAALEEQKRQEKALHRLLELSKEYSIPCVATNDTRYLHREDWRAHEILLNVASGEPCEIWERDSQGNAKVRIPNPKRKVMLTHEYDFKAPEKMFALFADCPEALHESVKIAEKCQFAFDFKARFYPVFVPKSLEEKQFTPEEREREAAHFLQQLCEEGIAKRYTAEALAKVAEKYPGKSPEEVVRERMNYELDLIISKGLGDYLLIVYDFISWAKAKRIPMGPGRGSGAGSIVCYLTGITDIEPLRFSLFFERFINPERISYPDIDVDICMERRQEVIEYTVRKYGKEKVAQIITFGTMKAKMAIKDVGRVLSIPLAKVNEIAKLVPEDPTMTLDRALDLDPDLKRLYETDPETAELLDLAKKLEGSVRNTGIHAAGMIISADSIMEHIPVCTAKDSQFVVTQYAMKPVELVGMLKIDFLGLKTLTAIQLAVDAIQDPTFNWIDLTLDDKKTFDLLNQGKTLGIFQLESGGMQELAKQLHIDKFEEIVAVGALYRPGPMEMIPSFIRRKHGKESIEIDHPLIADILAETYGIMVYQEQVMQIASLLAGYSLGEGDVLRRAMGKKDHVEMAKQREKFRLGALQNGIDPATSMTIFDKIEKFASYGFNKSHAAAYGYLSYVTAYLKANYPTYWMAALLTTDRDDLSKVTKILRECQAMNIAILPPDINESDKQFMATPNGIRFAMAAIKGVGEGVVEMITKERKKTGLFSSLANFVQRIDTNKVGKKTIDSLIEAGAFDYTGWTRAQLLANLEPIYQCAQKQQKDFSSGQMSLFGPIGENESIAYTQVAVELPKAQILKRERELLGFYLTGHPLDQFQEVIERLSCSSLEKLLELDSPAVCRTTFVIEAVTIKLTAKSGKKFAVLTVGDRDGRIQLPIWPELYEEKGYLFQENQILYSILSTEKRGEEVKVTCHWLEDLSLLDEKKIQESDTAYARARLQKKNASKPSFKESKPMNQEKRSLLVKIDANQMRLSHVLQLKTLLRNHPGTMSLQLNFLAGERLLGQLQIDPLWGITPSNELLSALQIHPAVILVDFLNPAF